MLLSKRTQYGIRAMVCFAEAYERGFLQAKELSKREKLPPKFLESILSMLTHGNYLVSKIGSSGGYRLARPPRAITLGEIVAQLEGRRIIKSSGPAGTGRIPTHAEQGERPGDLAIRLIHGHLADAVRQVLDTMTLADLAEQINQFGKAGQMYFI